MSAAANSWLKDRPLLTVLFSFMGSMILALSIRASDIKKEELDSKANKSEVQLQFKASDLKVEQNSLNIGKLEKADIRNQELFLDEVRQLRIDLNLKQNKP